LICIPGIIRGREWGFEVCCRSAQYTVKDLRISRASIGFNAKRGNEIEISWEISLRVDNNAENELMMPTES
jgi:hypothetical protein